MPVFVNPAKATALLLTALLVTTVGCSVRKESSTARPPAGLRDALLSVQANDTTRSYVEYSNVSAINDLVRADQTRFEALQPAGLGGLRAHGATPFGIDPQQMRTRIAAGSPTHGAGRWWGDYDPRKVDSWFAGRGGTREEGRGRTVWHIADEASFTIVESAPGLLLWANAREALDWVATPGRRTLAVDPTIAALTTCLDDVVAAVIARGANPEVTYAAGVRAGSATDVTEILCAIGKSIGSVDYVTRVVHEAISPTGEPYASVLPGATVVRAGSSVQVRWRPTSTTPAGRSLDMLHNREHEPIFGAA